VRFTDTSGWFELPKPVKQLGQTVILIDKKNTDPIIGAHLFGHDYAELPTTIRLAKRLPA
jgi:glutathione reductase (NADPH)